MTTTLHKGIPDAQQAWQVNRRGPPSTATLSHTSTAPVPAEVGAGYIVVNVSAAGLTPLGWKLGKYMPTIPFIYTRPRVAEYDFCGIVVDANNTGFSNGDLVYGILKPFQSGRQGTLCQYITVPAVDVVLKPSTISVNEAAGLALNGITAYAPLIDIAKIERGQRVFINGGSSSVGSLAIQIAKEKGCLVTTTTSARNIDLVKSLGADEVLDYTQTPPHIHLLANPPAARFHVIYDAIGNEPDLFLNSEAYLAPGGVFLSIGASIPYLSEIPSLIWKSLKIHMQPAWLGGVDRKYYHYGLGATGYGTVLAEFNKLIVQGKVRPLVDSVYPFEDVIEAYARLMTGHTTGKVVVKAPPATSPP